MTNEEIALARDTAKNMRKLNVSYAYVASGADTIEDLCDEVDRLSKCIRDSDSDSDSLLYSVWRR